MDSRTKLWSLMTATLASGFMMSGSVTAATITCAEIPGEKNYMEMDSSQASACLASGVGNIAGDGPDAFLEDVDPSYTFLAKSEPASSPTELYSLAWDDAGEGEGTWAFDSSVWNDYDTIALGFKFGGANEPDNWFVYELVSDVSSGDWKYIADAGAGLSHMNIYGKDAVQVPEPGTLALFGLGIIGLTLASRKTRAN